jgi:hypothetical protein
MQQGDKADLDVNEITPVDVGDLFESGMTICVQKPAQTIENKELRLRLE